MKTLYFTLLFCSLIYSNLASQQDWQLVREESDMNIFERKPTNSKFKQVKIKTTINAPLSKVVAILEDISNQKNWMYGTKEVTLLPQENEVITYMITDMPFPIKDRDIVIKYERYQDPNTRVVNTKTTAVNGYKPLTDKFERIKDFTSTYKLVPLENGLTQVEYYLEADPGGNLPAWVVNLFTTKGPSESMKSLIELAESEDYNGRAEDIID